MSATSLNPSTQETLFSSISTLTKDLEGKRGQCMKEDQVPELDRALAPYCSTIGIMEVILEMSSGDKNSMPQKVSIFSILKFY